VIVSLFIFIPIKEVTDEEDSWVWRCIGQSR
jgi:hypothetical protein